MSQRCPNCRVVNADSQKFCSSCGVPLTTPNRQPVKWNRLFLLLIPVVLMGVVQEGARLNALLFASTVTAITAYFVRREIVALIQRVERQPALRPAWEFQKQIPSGMRRILGVAAAFIISYYITESTEWGGLQSMIVSVVIATPAAYFFMRKPFL